MAGTRVLDRTTAGTGEIFCAGRPVLYQFTVLNTGTDGQVYGGQVYFDGSNDGLGWFRVGSQIVQSSTGFITTGFFYDEGAWDRVRCTISGMDANARIIVTMALAPE